MDASGLGPGKLFPKTSSKMMYSEWHSGSDIDSLMQLQTRGCIYFAEKCNVF